MSMWIWRYPCGIVMSFLISTPPYLSKNIAPPLYNSDYKREICKHIKNCVISCALLIVKLPYNQCFSALFNKELFLKTNFVNNSDFVSKSPII